MFLDWLRRLFGSYPNPLETPVIEPQSPIGSPEPIEAPEPEPEPVVLIPEPPMAEPAPAIEPPMPEPPLPVVKDMRNVPLPDHARDLLEAALPWDKSEFIPVDKLGIQYDGVRRFLLDNGRSAILMTADADIDIDGPGGSTATDKYWLPETSLRWPDGRSCDSRHFPGVVVPGDWKSRFGVLKGDFAYLIYRGIAYPAQVYDFGPTSKVGEVSLALGRLSGIVPPTQSDHSAATYGNNAEDVVYLIFQGSGPGHAIEPKEIASNALDLWQPGVSDSMIA